MGQRPPVTIAAVQKSRCTRAKNGMLLCMGEATNACSAGAGPSLSSQVSSSSLAGALASVKGFIFYATTFLLALPLFAIMLMLAPFVVVFDKHRRLAQHFVNNIWAKVSTTPYYSVQV